MSLRTRGRLLTSILAGADKATGGRERTLALLPPEVRDRVEPIWVATGWYDAAIAFALIDVLAGLQGGSPIALLRRASERAAEADIEGIYRAQLHARSVRDMSERLPRIYERYYDAPMTTLELEGGEMKIAWSAIPAVQAPYFEAAMEGFIGGALRTAGAERVRFAWARSGHGDVTCAARVTWDL